MMMESSVFEKPALIGYLVKVLKSERPGKQIGKTIVQKMVFLLMQRGVVDFAYSMYHYGPYSSGVSTELNFAENSDIVEIEWIEDRGYFITPGDAFGNFESLLTKAEKQEVDKIVKEFGGFTAEDLSLIATALYLRDNFDVSDDRLPEVVRSVKEQYSVKRIKDVLKEGKIIQP